jgi:hypothetical protein
MTDDTNKNQPTLFETKTSENEEEKIILFALGEFQTRGFELIDRELPLDRLRGAFKRAAETFGYEEFSDEKIADILRNLGAKIVKVPNYVAKHPFRITVDAELAINASEIYKQTEENKQ